MYVFVMGAYEFIRKAFGCDSVSSIVSAGVVVLTGRTLFYLYRKGS